MPLLFLSTVYTITCIFRIYKQNIKQNLMFETQNLEISTRSAREYPTIPIISMTRNYVKRLLGHRLEVKKLKLKLVVISGIYTILSLPLITDCKKCGG